VNNQQQPPASGASERRAARESRPSRVPKICASCTVLKLLQRDVILGARVASSWDECYRGVDVALDQHARHPQRSSSCSTASRYTFQGVGFNLGVTLASEDPIAKKTGMAHQTGAGHLELPRPLQEDSRHDPQRLFLRRARDRRRPSPRRARAMRFSLSGLLRFGPSASTMAQCDRELAGACRAASSKAAMARSYSKLK
jgi:hypothetical protein